VEDVTGDWRQLLYGCGTWCLAVRREHRLRLFENRVLREILGSEWRT